VEREITIIHHIYYEPDTYTFNTTTSVTLESPTTILSHDFKWENYEFSSNQTSVPGEIYYVEINELVTFNPVIFLLLYLLYTLLSYFLASWLALINLHYGKWKHVFNKILPDHIEENIVCESEIFPDNFRGCLDCGSRVLVKLDWSGICQNCKRTYMVEQDWDRKFVKTITPPSTSRPAVHLNFQENLHHWDEYQTNLDETSNDLNKFKISYPLIVITLLASILLMTLGIILTYSKVQYDSDGTAKLVISGWGLILHLCICVLSGYYIGKHLKKAIFAIPFILTFSFVAVYTGLTASPMIFNAIYEDNFIAIFIIQILTTALLSVSFGMASVSRYYYS
jgi:hypothetical protein